MVLVVASRRWMGGWGVGVVVLLLSLLLLVVMLVVDMIDGVGGSF